MKCSQFSRLSNNADLGPLENACKRPVSVFHSFVRFLTALLCLALYKTSSLYYSFWNLMVNWSINSKKKICGNCSAFLSNHEMSLWQSQNLWWSWNCFSKIPPNRFFWNLCWYCWLWNKAASVWLSARPFSGKEENIF